MRTGTDPGVALKLDAAVPVILRETGGLGRELIAFCRDSIAVPWTIGSNGAPNDTMIVKYRTKSMDTWSEKVRKFLKRQWDRAAADPTEKTAFSESCEVIAKLFVNSSFTMQPPESWRSSGFFVFRDGEWITSCKSVRTAILSLTQSADHFTQIIKTLVCCLPHCS